MGKARRRSRQVRQASESPTDRPAGPAFRFGRGTVVVALVAALLGAGVWLARHGGRASVASDDDARRVLAGRTPAPGELNLLLVTLDTLRADRLPCYGFRGVETPNLDRLCAEGVVFEQATATVPLTFPSHSSIFTGLVPPHHGVHDNGGFFLEDDKTTLAERLQAAGYATGAFVGAWVLESRWGLAQGFDEYSDHFDLSQYKTVSLGTVQKPGDEVADLALGWLDGVRARPFFAWVHLYDPHSPYEPPEPYLSRYPGQKYLGEIAYTDHVVGRLLTWLDSAGLAGRTLVVVMADHGESLGEHGESTHAFFVYDSTVHVPFLVRTPWGDRGRSRAQVSGVDVLPTVLDLLGQPAQPGIDGRSLARLVLDPRADVGGIAYSESYFPRFHFGWQHLRALRDGRYQFVEAPTPELYDLSADPGESTNVYSRHAATAEGLRQRLHALAGDGTGAAPERQEMDPDTQQRLAALGYVGQTVDVDPGAVLPDPKDKIGLFGRMSAAKAAAQDDRIDEAIADMEAVVAEDPAIVDAHVTLGNWYRRQGRDGDAIAAFQAALTLQPDNELALSNLANVYRMRGDNEAALAGYRRVLDVEPRNPQVWYRLATLLLDLGRVAEGERTFRTALEHNPKMGAAYNSLGAIEFSRGRTSEAERLVRRGLELEPDVRTGHFNLGRLLEAQGDTASAEKEYRQEIATYADNGKAHFNLAQLLRARGDRAGYLAELGAGVEHAPQFGACYFYLARERLSTGDFDGAADLAQRGLAVDSASDVAPLGYYVLADVYSRRGDAAAAEREAAKARRLEAALKEHPLPAI